ncbi:transposase [Roseovarius halotolerans]|nr:transposase [Roseovarius halotolerans]
MEHEAWLLRRTDDRDDPERHGEYEAGMAGMKAPELSRRQGIGDAAFYSYKAKFDGMSISDAGTLRALEDETNELKCMLAGVMLNDSASRDLATSILTPDL